MNKILNNFILWTWCLPQSLLGSIYTITYKNKIINKKNYKNISLIIIKTNMFEGLSLGKFIFINKENQNNLNTIKHEYGHTLQNYIFGPLYLIIITLPSSIQFWISKYNKNFKKNYFKRFPENWANKLGKVNQNKN